MQGLDTCTGLEMMQILNVLAQTQGHAVLCILQQPNQSILELCDKISVYSKGFLIFHGGPACLCSHQLIPTGALTVDKALEILLHQISDKATNEMQAAARHTQEAMHQDLDRFDFTKEIMTTPPTWMMLPDYVDVLPP